MQIFNQMFRKVN